MPSAQRPIDSGFTAASTAHDVLAGIDLSGKVAMVTGGHSGIGLETTRALSTAGATVVVPVRYPDKARERLEGIARVDVAHLDLVDPASIDAFAGTFLASGRPLHMLINSAGIMRVPLTRDSRGYEAHFATNHLGHFQLATRLWPALRRANGARVVAVSAWAHRLSPVHLDDPNFERRPYGDWMAYAQSKTANILFALALDIRGEPDGIRGFSLHPGSIITTDLSPWATDEDRRAMNLIDEVGNPVIDPERGAKNAEQGASTSVWCATSPTLDGYGGVYCENNNISPIASPDDLTVRLRGAWPVGVAPHAVNPRTADQLWDLSQRLVEEEPTNLVSRGQEGRSAEMRTAANKTLALRFFNRLSAGKLDAALDMMADTATWWVAGKRDQFALAGTYDKAQFTAMLGVVGEAMPSGIQLRITGVTAEDDRVAVEAEGHGESAGGQDYDNQFHYLLEVRDGKIQAGREYLDTIHARQVLLDQQPFRWRLHAELHGNH